jgi:hypothetical protein
MTTYDDSKSSYQRAPWGVNGGLSGKGRVPDAEQALSFSTIGTDAIEFFIQSIPEGGQPGVATASTDFREPLWCKRPTTMGQRSSVVEHLIRNQTLD